MNTLAETPNFNLPYPTGQDYVNIHKDIENLASAVDTTLENFTPGGGGGSDLRFDYSVGRQVYAIDSQNDLETRIYGHTGVYSIKHLMTDYFVEYVEGFGDITVFRENDNVTVKVSLIMKSDFEDTSTRELVRLPLGFKPLENETFFSGLINLVTMENVVTEVMMTGQVAPQPFVGIAVGSFSFLTADPWPTEEPGTPL